MFRMWRRVWVVGDVRQVDYMFRVKANRDWALGFGVGYVRDNGFVYLQPVPIVEGVVVSKDDCLPFNIDTSSQVSDNVTCPVCAGRE